MHSGRTALALVALLLAHVGLSLATAGDSRASPNEFPWQVSRCP